MNKEGNGFTFAFAAIMVVAVASVLSIAAIGLKPFQKENQRREMMQSILSAIDVSCTRDEAPALFDRHVKQRIVLDHKASEVTRSEGPIRDGDKNDAFNINVRGEFKSLPPERRNYPLFICEADGRRYIVIPMVGKGLWGPIWGFVGLEDDMNTVKAASFDHKTETPGLGAEIKEAMFERQFPGEQIFGADGALQSIKVMKGGADEADKHGVDAITGGTITSNGVTEMLMRTFAVYEPYLKANTTN